jgi:pilus assembly protein Flp/PilA
MKKYLTKAMVFFEDDKGAAAIEYALLASLIAVAIAAAVGLFGTSLASSFTNSTSKLFPG